MSAYTRATGKKALVLRTLQGASGGNYASVRDGLTVVPVSRVLREIECDRCHREVVRGEFVLRERDPYGFRTTCDLCANWVLAEDLL